MPLLLRCLVGLAIFGMAVAASGVFAQEWSDFATVSMTNATTPKLTANRVCYTDGRDMLCDGAAGLLTTSGTFSITNISATNLTVGGVAITGSSSGDRITSGTTSMVANSGTSIISITSAGVTAGYFNSNGVLTAPGISATSNLTSVTTLYASGRVGISTTDPSYSLVNGGRITQTFGSIPGLLLTDMQASGREWAIFSGSPLAGYFKVRDNTASADRIVIDTVGNVGIGTTSPNYSLDVSSGVINAGHFLATTSSTVGSNYLHLASYSSSQAGSLFGQPFASTIALWVSSSNPFLFGTQNSTPIIVGTNNLERLRIDASGNISATGPVRIGTSSLTCASGISGTIRYNTTSNTMEYCNGSAWANLGPSATTPVAFSVTKGSNQTITAATWTKMTWSTEEYDTNNNFASDRFTPTVPGKYVLFLNVGCRSGSSYCYAGIFKNGTVHKQTYNDLGSAAGDEMTQVTDIVDMNGTTDYVEAYGRYDGGTTLGMGSYFQGAILAAQGGSGGSTSPGGNNTNIQYNSSGNFAGSDNLAWDNTNRNLQVSGSMQYGGTGSEACSSAADYGKNRRNPTSGRMQVCLFR